MELKIHAVFIDCSPAVEKEAQRLIAPLLQALGRDAAPMFHSGDTVLAAGKTMRIVSRTWDVSEPDRPLLDIHLKMR